MLDVVREETSLEAKRRELMSKIAEGREVIKALTDRQRALSSKMEEAGEALERLQGQLQAVDVVLNLLPADEIRFQPPRPIAPVLEVVEARKPHTVPAAPAAPKKPERFKLRAFFHCVTGDGHDMVMSRAMAGYTTCRNCRLRRRV